MGHTNILKAFNAVTGAEAERQLLACCGSVRWAAALATARPYASVSAVIEKGRSVWLGLDEADWLEAFACHPRIGEKKAATTVSLASSETEQAEAQQTLSAVAERLVNGNADYEERFGFRYIVFASGRTAPELLAVLEARLGRTREQELQEAARQQMQITELRLRKWLAAEDSLVAGTTLEMESLA